MATGSSKPKCCRRVVYVTFSDNPPRGGRYPNITIDKQTKGNESSAMSQDAMQQTWDDIHENPDDWGGDGDPKGKFKARRPAIFCGDEIKEFRSFRDSPPSLT